MEVLGDYTIQKSLGSGVLGTVYLAEHKFIKKPFVLKVLPKEVIEDPSFFRRFEAEVAKIAKLDHPHIAKIHNVSFSEGLYYIVSDPMVDSYGETMDLERYLRLKGKGLSEEDREDLLRQVASALDYAHEQGVFHGALKLSNILIAPTEEGVKALLSDFGITRLLGEGFSFLRLCEKMARAFFPGKEQNLEKAHLQSKNFVRNFAFLAPEQKGLESSLVDQRVDVYAFGVLTYFVLTEKVPEGCFDPPSRYFPDAKKHWDLFVNRCLQVNPNGRPKKILLAMEEYLHAPRTVFSSEGEDALRENIHQMAFEFSKEAEKKEALIEPLKPVIHPPEIQRPEYEPDPGAIFQREMTVSHYVPKKVELHDIQPILTDMIVVPGGTYLRGSNHGARDEMPRHSVHLASFAIDIHPITNEQFVRFLEAMGGEKDQNNNDIIRLRDARIKRSAGKLLIESGYAKHPVVGVTWYGAVAYAKWVGKRLPTEAEWEAAASSGKDFLYPTGDDIERSQANFFSSDTTAVMSYPPNALGLYDIAGNVYEWCQDWYAYNYYETSSLEPDNPKGPLQGVYRALRGGCWKSLKEDLRCSHRHRNNPGAMNGTYGFRCSADVS